MVAQTKPFWNSHLDWITVSFEKRFLHEITHGVGLKGFEIAEETNPYPNYQQAWKLACGGTFNYSEDEKQGARLDLTGKPLHYLRSEVVPSWNDEKLLLLIQKMKYKKRTTRLDYCFNVYNVGNVQDTLEHWNNGDVKTVFRTEPDIYHKNKCDRGMTINFGSKDSKQYVQVYDKGAELKTFADWLRVELRMKDEKAQTFLNQCVQSSHVIAGRTRLGEVIDFPLLDWWQMFMHGERTTKIQIPRKKTNWRKWMQNQVAPTAIRHALESEDDKDFLYQWWAKITNEIRKYEKWE